MKSRPPLLRFRSVLLPPRGSGDGDGLAVRIQFIYAMAGLVVGIVFLVGGIPLLLSGILWSSHFIATVVGGKIDVSDAPTGLILAVLGALIIWVSGYRIELRGNKKQDPPD